MDALLSERSNLVGLPGQDVELEHLKEGIAVLRRKLNREIEVALRALVLEVAIL